MVYQNAVLLVLLSALAPSSATNGRPWGIEVVRQGQRNHTAINNNIIKFIIILEYFSKQTGLMNRIE